MRRALAPALLCALLAAGCSPDFAPQSDLLGLRVLALVADAPELAPGQPVTIAPRVYVPSATSVASSRFTFCPITAGSVAAYACAVPACEVALPTGPGDVATANPTQLIQQCLAQVGGALPPGVPEPVQTVFRYQVSTTDGASREAVLQVPQWLRQAPTDPNLNPVITGVEIGGVPAEVGVPTPPLPVNGTLPVRLLIDPASVQTYVDGAGVNRTETMTGYFYSTAGRFSNGATTGTDTTVDLEGGNVVLGQPPLEVFVVALDLRGGQAVAGPFTVPIGP